jgi:hypothetical protein
MAAQCAKRGAESKRRCPAEIGGGLSQAGGKRRAPVRAAICASNAPRKTDADDRHGLAALLYTHSFALEESAYAFRALERRADGFLKAWIRMMGPSESRV